MSEVFFVRFVNFRNFSVGTFITVGWKWDKKFIQPMSNVLTRKKTEIDKKKTSFDKLQLATIHFDGSIDPRDLRGKSSFKGKLYRAHAGNVIYSKIDVRNGAIGIIPTSMSEVAVSSEYPIYEVHSELADAGYIHLVFRTRAFQKILNSMISGASGRKRVQPTQIENVEIPIPPVETQRAIVSRGHEAQQAIAQAEEKISELEKEIEKRFFADLGLKTAPYAQNLKVFTAHWKDFERWSVSYNQAVLGSVDISKGKYPVAELGSILSMVQYGSSEKASTEKIGSPVIRMNNITDGTLDLSNLKYIRLPQKDLDRLVLKDGDILFNRTNSKELVGKCAVFHEKGNYIFASYLIRVRADETKANPDYVSFVLNNRIGRQQINALSRQIIGQANVNSQELRSLKLPLPPIQAQQEIMAHIETGRVEIAHQKEFAEKIRKDSETEIEALILGTKKI
jgi:type I restriction enzyme S subunit